MIKNAKLSLRQYAVMVMALLMLHKASVFLRIHMDHHRPTLVGKWKRKYAQRCLLRIVKKSLGLLANKFLKRPTFRCRVRFVTMFLKGFVST